MKPVQQARRGLLAGFAALVGQAFLPQSLKAAPLTPEGFEGPFYPTPGMRVSDTDNDLVKIAGRVREAGGEIITLKGRITDHTGTPLSGLRIEIWQCDVNGKYLHPGDSRRLRHDQGFQGFGHDVTDDEGRYRFRTIKPTAYPGRTPHIHLKVLDGGRDILSTQLYIKDDPRNAGDFLYNQMTAEEAALVSMVFDDELDQVEAVVNLVV
ncbi:protocatechuate 3,4-dioxygenase [Coralliovum pocilloporae]|uniref:protocatechuate 3,4-dioxygenase n=1 Tax=Coralliovum pocilloporae TaxID=3066369 RepID=UPI0033078144